MPSPLMNLFEHSFDLLLAGFILIMVWKALRAEELYEAAVYFVAFGLAMAIAWARLEAPDVALAEAAIGAGLLGVLLLDSIRVFHRRGEEAPPKVEGTGVDRVKERGPRILLVTSMIVLCSAVAIIGLMAMRALPEGGGLTGEVGDRMGQSGVEHPVTAVLLNFRSFDTWLEIGVLLLAMLGIFCVGGLTLFPSIRNESSEPLDLWLVRVLVPLIVLVGVYLLWLGKFAPGGAFQSGVVLASIGILLRLAGLPSVERLPHLFWKGVFILGFAAFLSHGLWSVFFGRKLLEFSEENAGSVILVLEVAATASIALTLAAFFVYLNGSDRESGVDPGENGPKDQTAVERGIH